MDATTGEIAKRARVSKRDIYAYFPNKQALLMGIIVREMQRQDETFRQVVERLEKLRSLRSKLEDIGLAVVDEILCPKMGVVRRLVVSESINQPFLGDLFFEGGVAQRCKLIAEVLAAHQQKKGPSKSCGTEPGCAALFFDYRVLPLSDDRDRPARRVVRTGVQSPCRSGNGDIPKGTSGLRLRRRVN